MSEKIKVLLVGGTGQLGKLTAEALLKHANVELLILARKENLTSKKDLLDSFVSKGAEIVEGDFHSKELEHLKKNIGWCSHDRVHSERR